jgi:ATP-dependent HslUV protease subunit HslV
VTVAVAVQKDGEIVLAADTLVNFGGQRFPTSDTRLQKIHRIGDSLIAWAGWSLYAELLTAHLAATPRPPRLDSEADVFAFFVAFWRAMRSDYTFVQSSVPREGHPFATLESTFLLVNPSGIYRVADDMDVTTFLQYTAIGSGSKYAIGALRVLYDQDLPAAEIARRAVQVGIDFDVYCGGPIDCKDVREGTSPGLAARETTDEAPTAEPAPDVLPDLAELPKARDGA